MLKSVLHYLETAAERFTEWAGAPPDLPYRPAPKPSNAAYRVYTKEFDIVMDGAALAKSTETVVPEYDLEQRPPIGAFVETLRKNCVAMSNRLQQSMTAEQRNDTVVTLLFDHSGSLRHNKNYLAVAEVAEALADSLTDAEIATEILGFTTVRWKGGEARKKWLQDGRPPLPGRLNDLLHVVHVDGSTGPRIGPHYFAVMREEWFLKENIDGEALEWAQGRLLENPRRRKILIMISDGAPVDDSTLAYSWASILHDHVKEVSARIASSTGTVLGGIGIEHNVQSYYPNDAMAKPVTQLADVVPDFIEKMIGLAHQSPVAAEK